MTMRPRRANTGSLVRTVNRGDSPHLPDALMELPDPYANSQPWR